MIPYTDFVASQNRTCFVLLEYILTNTICSLSQADMFVEILRLILKGLLHSNKQRSLLFTTSQSRSRSLFFFPSTSIMGNQSIAQYKDKSIRSVSCLFFRALRLKAKWISAVNTQRDEQLFERWSVEHLGWQ